jgi:hypothetical protein
MVNRTTTTAVLYGMTSLAFVAAGSGSAAAATSPTAWASTLCSSVSSWGAAVQAQSGKLTRALDAAKSPSHTMSVATGRAELISYLNGVAAASETVRARLVAAGTPNIAHGALMEQTVVAAFARFAAQLQAAETKVERFSNNPDTFAAQTAALGGTLSSDGNEADRAVSGLDAVTGATFGKLAENVASCRKLGA